jgi:SprT-like family
MPPKSPEKLSMALKGRVFSNEHRTKLKRTAAQKQQKSEKVKQWFADPQNRARHKAKSGRKKGQRSDRTLLRWYRLINQKFFDGVCPDRVCVRWASDLEETELKWEDKYFGWARKINSPYHDWEIVMSRSLNQTWLVRISTLVHEMVHTCTGPTENHGPAFSQWHEYITAKGIFRKHALRRGVILF